MIEMSCKRFITRDVASDANGIIETIYMLPEVGIPYFLQVWLS
jgi:hypothetical protein